MKAPGGFDHRGDDEAGEGGGDAIEGGGGNASQKLKLGEHLFALSMPLLMYCFSLFTSFTVNLLDHLYWICQVE